MNRRYTIGGVAFLVGDDLPGLDTDGFSDATLHVRFAAELPTVGSGSGTRIVTGPMTLTGAIDPDARMCTLPILSRDPADRAWQLRQMAPIFSAVLGRLVLHAGAVEMGDRVVSFVGESGAGKSTLARYLAGRGHRFVADDLLPIRFDPEPSAPGRMSLVPVGTVIFLHRVATPFAHAERLARLDALQNLMDQGFGEHGDAPTWAFQFDAYHRLSESVPAFDLMLPDDLTALPGVAQALEDLSPRDVGYPADEDAI